ncbi:MULTISPECIES: LexA family transcriptional regulator [Burkholderia]|uniref:LexA family transcriptional regulator n=1 Tax=Burkholderia TaxID=32008 RepID=UPI0024B7C872|nr:MULTISPECIES: S24 family peptidase [Burkholderia]MDI9680449.1 S24 family peptidase [Burkholderia cenocepacia]WRS69101.1 S24 family peptidase [Burkholderia thailandensis]
MSTLDQRIQTVIDETGAEQIELAAAAGVTKGTVNQWLDGKIKSIKLEYALGIEERWGYNPVWLVMGRGPKKSSERPARNESERTDVIQIPRFDTGGAMGYGLELRDQPGIIETLRVNNEWISKNLKNYTSIENLCVVTGFGDSMRPMFNPGDPLIVDVGVRVVEYDAVYFFRVGDEGFIKRLQRIPTEDGLMLRAKSENPSYDTWDITPRMAFEVFGRVLKVWRSEDF